MLVWSGILEIRDLLKKLLRSVQLYVYIKKLLIWKSDMKWVPNFPLPPENITTSFKVAMSSIEQINQVLSRPNTWRKEGHYFYFNGSLTGEEHWSSRNTYRSSIHFHSMESFSMLKKQILLLSLKSVTCEAGVCKIEVVEMSMKDTYVCTWWNVFLCGSPQEDLEV